MNPKYRLTQLSDEALLSNLKRCVGTENQITALMLAHLAEIDARGAYRQWACATLVSYCVYELRLSEDEAQRRCRAARIARKFPILFEMLADASIHLTGIVLLAPHLTEDNHAELLARARYRTKREIEKLVAEIAPRSDVPTLIEPLGPAPDGFRVPAPSSWSSFVHGLAGYVRELVPGDERSQAPSAPPGWLEATSDGGQDDNATEVDDSSPNMAASEGGSVPPAPEPLSAPARPAAMRYKIQFTADQVYVDLLEQARDLLEHQVPDRDLPTVQRLAIEALLDKLNARKYGATNGHERRACGPAEKPCASEEPSRRTDASVTTRATASFERTPPEEGMKPEGTPEGRTTPQLTVETPPATPPASTPPASTPPLSTTLESTPPGYSEPTPRSAASRHLPAGLRRRVAERDGHRCSYVDSRGVRCRETARLEFHHELAHAHGGAADPDNIRLRCRAHNDLAAELDFGRAFMQRKKRGEPAPSPRSAPARSEGRVSV